MNWLICELMAVPVRAEASHRSEMVTQLLFGEMAEILRKEGAWYFIRNHYDGYQGWVWASQIRLLHHEESQQMAGAPGAVVADLFAEAQSAVRSILISAGATLPFYDKEKHTFRIAGEQFTIHASAVPADGRRFPERIGYYALKFAGLPYLWGGRSPAGLDCSGFTQVVMKMAGIRLPRDAWQQAEQGLNIPFLEQAQPGDLAFFSDDDGRITHTGILLTNQKIIHASGYVRMDDLDHHGIFNRQLARYSHKLRLLRRMV